MKNKKITLYLIIFLIISILVSIFQYYSIDKVKKNIFNYETRNGKLTYQIEKYDFYICNWNIFKPEMVFMYKDFNNDDLEIGFYDTKKDNLIFGNWNFEYTGGTTVKNTTFENLLLMVKEDCYQFQKTFYQNDDNKLYWTWSKSIKETPEQIEKRKKRKEEIKRQIESGELEIDTRTIEEIKADRLKRDIELEKE